MARTDALSRWRHAALAALVAASASCGGGGDSGRVVPPPAPRTVLSGTLVADGTLTAGAIEAKPASGLPMVSAHDASGQYELIVEPMKPPYVLRALSPPLTSVATGPGITNVTPLTHLLVATLAGDDPNGFFDVLGPLGGADFSGIDAAAIADAGARLRERLRRQFDFELPDELVDVLGTPFEPVAGDPMFELIGRLRQMLEARGLTLSDLTATLAAQSRRCGQARLDMTGVDGAATFCPAELGTQTGIANPALTTYRFTDDLGESLELVAIDSSVQSLRIERNGVLRHGCTGTACTGLTIGAAGSDGRRKVHLDGVPLDGPAGRTQLSGTLTSGTGAVDVPCAGRRITLQAGSAAPEIECVARRIVTRQFGRRAYSFVGRLDGTRVLDVRADGGQVAWVALTRTFGGIEYRCIGSGCAGVTVEPPDAQGLRRIRLQGTPLHRSLGEGVIDPADVVTVSAELVSGATPPLPLEGCAAPVALTMQASDPERFELCDTLPGSSIGQDDTDGDGRFETLLTDTENLQGDRVEISFNRDLTQPNSVVFSRPFLDAGEVAYRCDGTACQGVTMTATSTGRFLFKLDGTVLTERLPDGTPGTRNVLVSGTVLSALFSAGD